MDKPNAKYSKYCLVPKCESSTVKTPGKIFISLPVGSSPKLKKKRKLWLRAMRRDGNHISENTRGYVCEDHFDLEQDMRNYIRYKLMGGNIYLKEHVVPHIFKCQSNRKENTERTSSVKRNRKKMIEGLLDDDAKTAFSIPYNTNKYQTKARSKKASTSSMSYTFQEEINVESENKEQINEEKTENTAFTKVDEYDFYAKYVVAQLKQLPSDLSINCKNEIQSLFTKTRMTALNAEENFLEATGACDLFGLYISKKLSIMKPVQQCLAEKLVYEVISEANANRLSKSTDIVNEFPEEKNKISDTNDIPSNRGIPFDDVEFVDIRQETTEVYNANIRNKLNRRKASPSISDSKNHKRGRLKSTDTELHCSEATLRPVFVSVKQLNDDDYAEEQQI